jgi:GntR family transcriptional regulator/MocR family aminotransferase
MLEQKVLCSFIENGNFGRHLNKMRTIYKKKRDTLVKAINDLNCNFQILGADAGLHLLLRIPNGMSEEELIQSALLYGVKTYGISKYYIDDSYREEPPTLLLGYATMTEDKIKEAVRYLKKAWL